MNRHEKNEISDIFLPSYEQSCNLQRHSYILNNTDLPIITPFPMVPIVPSEIKQEIIIFASPPRYHFPFPQLSVENSINLEIVLEIKDMENHSSSYLHNYAPTFISYTNDSNERTEIGFMKRLANNMSKRVNTEFLYCVFDLFSVCIFLWNICIIFMMVFSLLTKDQFLFNLYLTLGLAAINFIFRICLVVFGNQNNYRIKHIIYIIYAWLIFTLLFPPLLGQIKRIKF